MDIFEKIDLWVREASKHIPQKRREQKIRLYTEGLKAKIIQVNYALSKLYELSDEPGYGTTSTGHYQFEIAEQVNFYCDSFWTFLYSSFDILAQIVNQAMGLGLQENNVSFNKLGTKLHSNAYKASEITKSYVTCLKSRAFINLTKYRHCSIHRRQIYIQEDIRLRRGTAGYQTRTVGPATSVVRILCDNPIDQQPKITARYIPDYLEDTKEKILQIIESILSSIPVNQ